MCGFIVILMAKLHIFHETAIGNTDFLLSGLLLLSTVTLYLLQVNDGDAGTAELDMLVLGFRDVGNGVQILTDELAENA